MTRQRDEFVSFYETAKDDCFRTVLVSVGRVEVAEDLVAEAFARAWATWEKLREHPAPRAWVVRTALNAHVSSWRRHRRETEPSYWHEPSSESTPSPDEADPELIERLRRLPARQREVVALRLFLDLDTAQTAEVRGIAPGTVTAHLARAISVLRTQYASSQQGDTSR